MLAVLGLLGLFWVGVGGLYERSGFGCLDDVAGDDDEILREDGGIID